MDKKHCQEENVNTDSQGSDLIMSLTLVSANTCANFSMWIRLQMFVTSKAETGWTLRMLKFERTHTHIHTKDNRVAHVCVPHTHLYRYTHKLAKSLQTSQPLLKLGTKTKYTDYDN